MIIFYSSYEHACLVLQDKFVSREGKSKHQLWQELCMLISKNPTKVRLGPGRVSQGRVGLVRSSQVDEELSLMIRLALISLFLFSVSDN